VIGEELRLCFVALRFLTRLPCPPWVGHRPEDAARSTLYFPIVGLLAGGWGALIYALVRRGYAPGVAALCGMAAIVVVTGAFHEDAFADVCDGFGGWTPQRRLEIMRDSRLGTYGVAGLFLLLSLKALLLAGMSAPRAMLAFVIAHTMSRASSALMLACFPAIAPSSAGSSSLAQAFAGGISPWRLTLACAIAVGVAALAGPLPAVDLSVATFLICLAAGRFFMRWLGGLSGDCLGAVNQAVELACYFLLARA
jgi:adenosylcobinamide-GDP ribazoletransferase